MKLKHLESNIVVRARVTARPPNWDEPYGRDMRTPQQYVDENKDDWTDYVYLLLTEIIDEPPVPAEGHEDDTEEWYGSPLHNEVLEYVASNCGVDEAVPMPVLAYVFKDGSFDLALGDFHEHFVETE